MTSPKEAPAMMTNFPVPPFGTTGNPMVTTSAGMGRPQTGFGGGMGGFVGGGMGGGQVQAYRPDSFGSRMGRMGRMSYGPAVPMTFLANDWRLPVNPVVQRMESRLSGLGVHTSDDLLRRANTPFKRNFLASMCTIFDRPVTKTLAHQWINYWLGEADLLRTGMQVDTARLLQRSGITDVPSLARYMSPFDRLALYGTLTTNAIRFGYRMPSWGELSSACDAARSLPYAIRW
jgi:hypothetical protein